MDWVCAPMSALSLATSSFLHNVHLTFIQALLMLMLGPDASVSRCLWKRLALLQNASMVNWHCDAACVNAT